MGSMVVPSAIARLFELRSDPALDLARQSDAVAEARPAMAVRFHRHHVLRELVHVFFEQPGILGPGAVR